MIITKANFKTIYRISVTSRLIVIFIQFVANLFIENHKADAYRNKYSEEIDRINSFEQDGHRSKLEPYWSLFRGIEGLTRWDSQYLLQITIDGYTTERHLAFLPVYPLTVTIVKRLLFINNVTHGHVSFPRYMRDYHDTKTLGAPITENELIDYIISSIIGVILNNFILFPIAAISLYCLTKVVKDGNHIYSMNVVRWFCFNPASIFFSACYTESLYSALTFGSMFLIEHKAKKYNDKLSNDDGLEFKPLTNLHQLVKICSLPVILVALSTAVRSNGIVTCLFIGYQIIMKYLPLVRTNLEGWTTAYYLCALFELIQDTLFVLISALISCSGYLIFQFYSYTLFCVKALGDGRKEKGSINYEPPSWCSYAVPHPYRQVQRKYWNVGLFEYYQLKQLPNFMLALPVIFLILSGSNMKYKAIRAQKTSRPATTMNLRRLDLIQFPYYVQAVLLVLFSSVSINVQVTTRLIASSCPAMYWIATELSSKSRLNEKLVKLYFIGYFVLGTILHCNFYPWT